MSRTFLSREPMSPRAGRGVLCAAALAVFTVFALSALPARGSDMLTLRINDARVRPGSQAAVVIRTYASRPIDQGQLCFRSPMLRAPSPGGAPFMTLRDVAVFSDAGDTQLSFQLDTTTSPPTILVGFSSATGTINSSDGPMAVLFFDVDPAAVVGTRLPMVLDLGLTTLVGADGQPIGIRPVDGEVRVLDPAAPLSLDATGDQVDLGVQLGVGAGKKEALALGNGQIGLVLPPALRGLPHTVSIDPRYGSASLTVDDSDPSLLRIGFRSADGSLGRVPGPFLQVAIDTSAAGPGHFAVSLDPASTFLVDAAGAPLSLQLTSGEVFLFGQGFFVGDFEAGDFSAWSQTFGTTLP